MVDKKLRGKTAAYVCQRCNKEFEARVADRNRGWARFCSKSCKAAKQESKTGWHREYQQHKENYGNQK